MKNLFILLAFVFTNTVVVFGQQPNNDEVKYVIFTSSDKDINTKEGMFRTTYKSPYDTRKAPNICIRLFSKARNIYGYADCFQYDLEKLAKQRKVTERDKRVIKETSESFLDSVDIIDMDILFPKMTKEEFDKFWDSLYLKSVYFIDRSEIKNKKIKLYPVKTNGINQY